MTETCELASALSVLNSLDPVSQSAIGTGGQQPGKVAKRFGQIWFQGQNPAELGSGPTRITGAKEESGKVEPGLDIRLETECRG